MLKSIVALLCCGFAMSAFANEWPQEVIVDEGTIVVYQPQPEKLEGNTLYGRAAFSLELKHQSEPIFGAMWFTARLDTDMDERTAIVRDLTVTRVGWPGSTDQSELRFTTFVEERVSKAEFVISVDRLSESLERSDAEQKSLDQLKHDPPKILFRDHLAVLLIYDGEPRFAPVEGSSYERALNTPFAVVRDTKTQKCYLSSGALWYEAGDPKGPWTPTGSPPSDLVQMLPKSEDPAPANPPEIVVATEPTELICTDGKAEWQALPDGEILYVRNTETPWLREISTNEMYILISGRWYRASSQEGPWTFVRPDALPASFRNIPPDSDVGGVRTSIAGTEEAEDAMLNASIPQTSTIKRSEAKLSVEYDGDPKFEQISGTDVSYAVNTGTQVLQINGMFYAVDNGVWFASSSAIGPWAVADSIPTAQIEQIPPTAPVYNVTYVHIYEVTPVYVTYGYYPGYMWSFPYYGVPVYGTGYYYPPYWGHYYYPRPPTWGFHVGYNPWTGWNYGVSWSNGFMTVGVSWGGGYRYPPHRCCGGWYGGGYHRGPTVINTGDINIGNSVSAGNRANISNNIRNSPDFAGNRSGSQNLYNRPENRARNATPAASRQSLQTAQPSTRPNNVYADKQGNVARHSGDGWENRSKDGWTKPQQSQQRSELDRSQHSRQSGQAREQRMGGASRGGGRRGR